MAKGKANKNKGNAKNQLEAVLKAAQGKKKTTKKIEIKAKSPSPSKSPRRKRKDDEDIYTGKNTSIEEDVSFTHGSIEDDVRRWEKETKSPKKSNAKSPKPAAKKSPASNKKKTPVKVTITKSASSTTKSPAKPKSASKPKNKPEAKKASSSKKQAAARKPSRKSVNAKETRALKKQVEKQIFEQDGNDAKIVKGKVTATVVGTGVETPAPQSKCTIM